MCFNLRPLVRLMNSTIAHGAQSRLALHSPSPSCPPSSVKLHSIHPALFFVMFSFMSEITWYLFCVWFIHFSCIFALGPERTIVQQWCTLLASALYCWWTHGLIVYVGCHDGAVTNVGMQMCLLTLLQCAYSGMAGLMVACLVLKGHP